MNKLGFAEYIWLDGNQPSPGLRSKSRVLSLPDDPQVADFPRWSFDGKLTHQADSHDQDCVLAPMRCYPDPLRGTGHYLVLCEVYDAGGCTHLTNQRAPVRNLMQEVAQDLQPWLGFEQLYQLVPARRPDTDIDPHMAEFCGLGYSKGPARALATEHSQACLDAGLLFYGMNAEPATDNWCFQIGPRDIDGERCDALTAADDLWVARYLLERLAERVELRVRYHGGDPLLHLRTSLSTRYTRDPRCGLDAIEVIVDGLENGVLQQPPSYRCACDLEDTFSSGFTRRTAALRIPALVVQKGYGYLVDHRPCADADPYELAQYLIRLIRGDDAAALASGAA